MLLSPLRMRRLLFRGFATPVSRFSGRKNCNLGRRGIADLPCAQDYGARAARNTEVLVRGTHTFMYRRLAPKWAVSRASGCNQQKLCNIV